MKKYNDELSDYNSEQQKADDIQKIGHVIFNKCGGDAFRAWLRFKEYVRNLEKDK